MKKPFLISALVLWTCLASWAQSGFITVKGLVLDESDQPVIGAAVMEAGTQNAVITDMDGSYSIKCSPKSVLNISSLGFVPVDVNVNNRTFIKITMTAETELLDEAIAIGYGSISRKEMTSAISHIDAAAMNTISSVSAAMLIQGKVSSVSVSNTAVADPNSTGSIQIRGITSRDAGMSPLIVVDGVPAVP